MRTALLPIIVVLSAASLTACDGVQLVGPAAENCGAAPYFSVSPATMGDIENIVVVGSLGAPGHTLPTAHAGFYLATEGATVRAPGPMQITTLRRTTYIRSPNREGKSDYTADFSVCKQISGWFGHLTTLSDAIPVTGGWKECDRYSTAFETVETCRAKLKNVSVAAGQLLGTSGLSKALGLMGLDFGLMDSRVNNGYVADWRHPEPSRRSICAWDKFETSVQPQLFSKLRDPSRPRAVAEGEPRCGTMQVDVAGTLKGVWASPSQTSPVAGNETAYITLANYPYRPQEQLALSLGPDALGAGVAVVARASGTGRANRPFDQITHDGLTYCYGPDIDRAWLSWLVTMTSPSAISIRKVENFVSNTCTDAPSTWTMAGSVMMVR